MAKLSARGRTEVARFEKEFPSFDPERVVDYIITRALMSDGMILEKSRWCSKYPLPGEPPQKTAWKIHARLKAAPEEWITHMEKKGWTRL